MVDIALTDDELRMDSRIEYIPTPKEIAAACDIIRESWSLCERQRRFVGSQLPDGPAPAWHPPVIDTAAFRVLATRRGGDLTA